MSVGGLTQHTQASHSAARRHPPRPPSPQPLDPEPGPYDRYLQDDAAAREEDLNYEDPRQQPEQGCRRGAFTNFHPLLDGKSLFIRGPNLS